MRAQNIKPKRVSAATSEAFEALVRETGVEIVAGAWKESIPDEKPMVEDFQKYWSEVLANHERSEDLIESISGLVQAHPVEGEGQDLPRSDATYIGDMKQFRASLQPSEDLGVMVEWGDLPVSKF